MELSWLRGPGRPNQPVMHSDRELSTRPAQRRVSLLTQKWGKGMGKLA